MRYAVDVGIDLELHRLALVDADVGREALDRGVTCARDVPLARQAIPACWFSQTISFPVHAATAEAAPPAMSSRTANEDNVASQPNPGARPQVGFRPLGPPGSPVKKRTNVDIGLRCTQRPPISRLRGTPSIRRQFTERPDQ